MTAILSIFKIFDLSDIRETLQDLAKQVETSRKISATIKELNGLSDKELADIGINRGMIYDVAHSAYKV